MSSFHPIRSTPTLLAENRAINAPSRFTRLWGLVIALAAVMGSTSQALAQVSSPRALGGRWNIVLTSDSVRSGGGNRTGGISGTMVLVAVPGVERPTFRGSYQVPFSTFGFRPDAAPVLAWVGRLDSIRVVLNPDVDHGHAELAGAWVGGRIEGRWLWVGDKGTGGTFSLTRSR